MKIEGKDSSKRLPGPKTQEKKAKINAYGPDADCYQPGTLHRAVMSGDAKEVETLLTADAENGRTALHLAAGSGQIVGMNRLMDAEAGTPLPKAAMEARQQGGQP